MEPSRPTTDSRSQLLTAPAPQTGGTTSVTISIEADGQIESRHNRERVLWELDVDVAAWGDGSVPADLAISEALELSFDEIAEHVDPTA